MKTSAKIIFLFILFVAIVFSACDGGGGSSDTSMSDSDIVTSDASALDDSDIVFSSNQDTTDSVTGNFTLPASGANGSTISWESDNDDVILIAPDGTATVTRPAYSSGSATITITAIISKGRESETVFFELVVLAASQTVSEAVEADAAALDESDFYFIVGSDTFDSVTGNFTLPISGESGSTITWESDNEDVITIALDGIATVRRPSYGTGNALVNLSAIIEKGDASETVYFDLNVLQGSQYDYDAVSEDAAALVIYYAESDNESNVTQNVTLPNIGNNGSMITWESSDQDIIADDGSVTRPLSETGNVTMTLTATIEKGIESETKVFELIVICEESKSLSWARSITGGTDSSFDSVTVDRTGNIYAAGFIRGTKTYTFGTGVTATGSGGYYNVVLVKYDASGTAQWARTVTTGTDYTEFNSVTVDNTGNVYAAGYIGAGTYTFGPDVTAIGRSNKHVVLVKYDASGTALWARTVTSGTFSRFNSVTIDSTGNVYAAGYIGAGTYTFGTGVTASWAVSGGNQNVVIVKYDADGTALWARSITGGTDSRFNSVTVDSTGNVYAAGGIAGTDWGTETYNFGTGVTAIGSCSYYNVVLVKYDASGSALWASTVTSGTNSSFDSVTVDRTGNVYAAGYIRGTETYAFGTDVTATGTDSYTNLVLVKYDTSGTARWARSVTTGSDYNEFNSVTVDITGNVYSAGFIFDTFTYTFGTDVMATGTNSYSNAVLVKYNANGTARWAETIPIGRMYKSVAVDSTGHVYVAGQGSVNAVLVKY